ncbi:MAG: DUF4351 domain-containing protein [Raineya sp.]
MIQISRDTLWKGIIEDLFEDFLLYFYPDWTKKYIDLKRKPQFMDKELAKIYPEGAKKKFADKLVKVFSKTGKEQWLLIHIEVQGYEDKDFAERMFVYFYRIKDRWQKDITALAILTDNNPEYLPNQYEYRFHRTRNLYQFDVFKILTKTEKELNIPDNPFSIVMLTAKRALEKKLNSNDEAIFSWKKDLILALKEANYATEKIRKILDFIHTYVNFRSNEIYENFLNFTDVTFKNRKNMGIREAILNEVREQGIQQGIEKGIQQGIEKGIQQGIKKALEKSKFSVNEIAEIFEVELDVVMKIQKELEKEKS